MADSDSAAGRPSDAAALDTVDGWCSASAPAQHQFVCGWLECSSDTDKPRVTGGIRVLATCLPDDRTFARSDLTANACRIPNPICRDEARAHCSPAWHRGVNY